MNYKEIKEYINTHADNPAKIINFVDDKNGNNLLHLLLSENFDLDSDFDSLVKKLIECGIDPNKKNNMGQKAIDIAAQNIRNKAPLLLFLLDKTNRDSNPSSSIFAGIAIMESLEHANITFCSQEIDVIAIAIKHFNILDKLSIINILTNYNFCDRLEKEPPESLLYISETIKSKTEKSLEKTIKQIFIKSFNEKEHKKVKILTKLFLKLFSEKPTIISATELPKMAEKHKDASFYNTEDLANTYFRNQKFNFSSTQDPKKYKKVFLDIFNLMFSKTKVCTDILAQTLEKQIAESKDSEKYRGVPLQEVAVIGNTAFPIPPKDYQPIKNKNQLLQNLARLVFVGQGLVEKEEHFQTFFGIIPAEIANASIESGYIFRDSPISQLGLIHGKYTHLLQLYIIKCAIDQKIIDSQGLSFDEILQNLITIQNQDGTTLWHSILDSITTSLFEKYDPEHKLIFISVTHFNAEIMLNAEKLPYLSGYLRNQFYNNIQKIINIHEEKFDILDILLAQVLSKGEFNAVKNIVTARDYYLGIRKDKYSEGKNIWFEGDLEEEGTIVIKPRKPYEGSATAKIAASEQDKKPPQNSVHNLETAQLHNAAFTNLTVSTSPT